MSKRIEFLNLGLLMTAELSIANLTLEFLIAAHIASTVEG